MKQALYIGIDPGQNGAIALLFPDGRAFAYSFTDRDVLEVLEEHVAPLLEEYDLCATIEQQQAYPGQGISSAFHLGERQGELRGWLSGHGVRLLWKRPAQWKKIVPGGSLATGDTKETLKRMARTRAAEFFPSLAGELGRVKDSDKAEALLIALVGRMLWKEM